MGILKNDFQGAEMPVFCGAERAWDSAWIKVISFEIITCDTYKNQSAIQDYLKFLDAKYHGLVALYDQANGHDGLLCQLDTLSRVARYFINELYVWLG